MLDLTLKSDDIIISSIGKEDALKVQRLIEGQEDYLDEDSYINSIRFDEFMKRFIEYYITENEIFFKILMDDEIIGVVKGRLEGKEDKELFLWFFMLDSKYRGLGMGKAILNILIDYFNHTLGVKIFSSGVCSCNDKAIRFWENNGFKPVRVTKNFFEEMENNKDLIIFKKIV